MIKWLHGAIKVDGKLHRIKIESCVINRLVRDLYVTLELLYVILELLRVALVSRILPFGPEWPKWQDCFDTFCARAQKVQNKGWQSTA